MLTCAIHTEEKTQKTHAINITYIVSIIFSTQLNTLTSSLFNRRILHVPICAKSKKKQTASQAKKTCNYLLFVQNTLSNLRPENNYIRLLRVVLPILSIICTYFEFDYTPIYSNIFN